MKRLGKGWAKVGRKPTARGCADSSPKVYLFGALWGCAPADLQIPKRL